ncbi:MAG: hypothetical protein M3160_01205 [Candidatus Eremiobacteraeota bacterium]|nr:hypothetical protein [Candidatus Eremiobacteraeota bacterium]
MQMQKQHIQRSAGYGGIAFVVLAIAGAALPGVPPDSTARVGEIAAYLDAHRSTWILSTWVALPAGAFFLWFAAGLNAYLREVKDSDEALLLWENAGAIAAATMYYTFSAIQAALVYHSAPAGGSSFLRGAFDVLNVLAAYFFAPLAIFVAAASLNARRHGALPRWIISLGFVAVAVDVIATLAPLFRAGPLAPGGFFVIIGFFVPMLWILAISIAMARTPLSR